MNFTTMVLWSLVGIAALLPFNAGWSDDVLTVSGSLLVVGMIGLLMRFIARQS